MAQTLNSNYKNICNVNFPIFKGRQLCMHRTTLANPKMPEGFNDYVPMLQTIGNALKSKEIVHVTIDEKIIQAGMSQRRPRPHVDGKYILKSKGWGHWAHYCNLTGEGSGPIERQSIIVASDISGCIAWKGVFHGDPKEDGDLEHISSQLDDGELLEGDIAWIFSPDCVHESMVFNIDTKRSWLRLALEDTRHI